MRNTKIIYRLLFGLLIIMITGCNHWLDINKDPNNPTDVPLNQLLPTIQVDIAGSVGMSTGGLSNYTELYTHQMVQRGTSNNDYGFNGSDFGVITPWLLLYTRPLTDIRQVISKAKETKSWHYLGVAEILKAYVFIVLVDLYGNVPYTEANLGAEKPYPRYDDGEAVYKDVLNLLDDGIANLSKESALTPLNDDLFYGGGDQALPKWRKFAKTLKLKMYNQARLVWDVSSEVNALVSEGDLIGPGEDFEFRYGTSVSPDNRNPGYSQEYAPGQAFNYVSPYFFEIMRGIDTFFPENIYLGINDPRIPYYFYNQLAPGQLAENPTSYKNGQFVSIYAFSYNIDPNEGFDQHASQTVLGLYPIGGRYDNGQGGAVNFNEAGDTPQRILTYFQVKYIEAELALEGLIPGNARTYFEEAIRASFDKVNEVAQAASAPVIAQSDIDAYVNAVLAKYDAGNNNRKLQHIMTQKWIASFGYGIDSYSDYRRTGYPVLHDGNTDNLSVTVRTRAYPLSFPWVTTDLETNPNAPKQKEVSSYRVFWDKN